MNHMLQLLLHTFLDLGEKYDGCHFALKNTFTPIKTINAKMARFPFSQRKIPQIPIGFCKKIKN